MNTCHSTKETSKKSYPKHISLKQTLECRLNSRFVLQMILAIIKKILSIESWRWKGFPPALENNH